MKITLQLAKRLGKVRSVNHIQYLAKIGAKGGRKRRDNDARHELASRAAKASWTTEARAKRLATKQSKRNDR